MATAANSAALAPSNSRAAAGHRPVVPAGIREKFLVINDRVPDGYQLEYRPGLAGIGKLHFVQKADGIDASQTLYFLQPAIPPHDIWQDAYVSEKAFVVEDQPDDRGQFAEVSAELSSDKEYSVFARQLKDHLFRERWLEFWRCDRLSEISNPNEAEEDFRNRLEPTLAQRVVKEREKVVQSFEKKLSTAETRVEKAQAKYDARWWRRFAQIGSALLVIVDNILSAFKINMPGRRRSLGTAVGAVAAGGEQPATAKIELDNALKEKERLEQEQQDAIKQLEAELTPGGLKLEPFKVKPQKGDVEAVEVTLVWLPFRISPAGAAEPVYEIAMLVES